MSDIYFKIQTRWKPTSERGSVVHTVRDHYGEGTSFTRLCTDIMFSVLKVLAVAIRTRSQSATRAAIEISKAQVDSFYQMALGLTQPDVNPTSSPEPEPAQSSGPAFVEDTSAADPVIPGSTEASGPLPTELDDRGGISLMGDPEELFEGIGSLVLDD